MRENRTCSSEGGEPGDRASLPYRRDPEFRSRMGPALVGALGGRAYRNPGGGTRRRVDCSKA